MSSGSGWWDWKTVSTTSAMPLQFSGPVRLARIDFGANLLHGKQQRLNGVNSACVATSYRIWPDDLIFALPMILFVDRNMDFDWDINVAAVGLEFQNPIQYDHSCLGPMISTLGGFRPARSRGPVTAAPCDGR